MGKGMVEGVEGALVRDGEVQRLLGGGVEDLHAGAVVVGAPVERDLDSAADAVGKLALRAVVDEWVRHRGGPFRPRMRRGRSSSAALSSRSEEHTSELQSPCNL